MINLYRNDFHLHSAFSDDSREPMENIIRKAIELGLEEICFTDHVDYGIKKDWSEGDIEYRPGDGMFYEASADPVANVDYPAYFVKLDEMRRKYEGQIRIGRGLEFGIQTGTIDRYEKLFFEYEKQLDFVLLSMHQVDNKELWDQSFQKGQSQQEYNERYYREIYEVQKRFTSYSVLAHLDLIVRYDLEGIYPFEKVEPMVGEILKKAISDGKGIEINTSSWHYGLKDTMPSRRILKLYKDLGGKIITVGSDGHNTYWLGDHIDEAVSILRDEIGFTEICTFENMKPVFHEI